MNRLTIAALIGAPFILAACEQLPGATVSAPTTGGTTVISTDMASLAGSYDTTAAACAGNPPSNNRVTISPTAIGVNGGMCRITGTSREGSALRVGLSCGAGQSPVATSAVVRRLATDRIEFRYGVDAARTLVQCGSGLTAPMATRS